MTDDSRLTEEELHKQFLQSGTNFFSWNSGKNTPNILLQLVSRIEKLEASVQQTTNAITKLDAGLREASASSTKLATALNCLTLASVVIASLGLTAFIIFEIAKLNR